MLELTERGADLAAMQQALADEALRLLYDSPVVLTGEMIYFARATALVEGLGVRHVPGFSPVHYVRPIVMRHRAAVLAALGPAEGDVQDMPYVLGLLARDVSRVVTKAGRELVGVLAARLPGLVAAGRK
jgi:hypothetical protein